MSSATSKPTSKAALSVVSKPAETSEPGETMLERYMTDLGMVAAPSDATNASPTPADQANTAVEAALAQFEAEYRPVIRRSDIARQRQAQQVREVEGLLSDLEGREALLDRVYEAAKRAIEDQRLDLTGELALYHHGMVGSAADRSE